LPPKFHIFLQPTFAYRHEIETAASLRFIFTIDNPFRLVKRL